MLNKYPDILKFIGMPILLILYIIYVLRSGIFKFFGYLLFRVIYYVCWVVFIYKFRMYVLAYTEINHKLNNFIKLCIASVIIYVLYYIDNKYISKYFNENTDIYYSYYISMICTIIMLTGILTILIGQNNIDKKNINHIIIGLYVMLSISSGIIILHKKYFEGKYNKFVYPFLILLTVIIFRILQFIVSLNNEEIRYVYPNEDED